MKKSQFKVIELFAYAVLVALAIIYAVSHGGFNAPIVAPPTAAAPPIIIEETQTSEEKNTNEPTAPPLYNLPPKGEFLP